MRVRLADRADAAALSRLVNTAFVVEAFFKVGDRTSAEELLALMDEGGELLVVQDPGGEPAGCIYLKHGGGRSYFGMLSVDPARQGQGLGRRLIEAAEQRARECGSRFMDIHIVNLREELPPLYRRFGYEVRGILPFSDPERTTRPCHFVVMSKALVLVAACLLFSTV